MVTGEKTALFVHFYIKMIILPRQARDKHKKNSKKVPFSCRLQRAILTAVGADDAADAGAPDDEAASPRAVAAAEGAVETVRAECARWMLPVDMGCGVRIPPPSFAPSDAKTDQFTKTGSG